MTTKELKEIIDGVEIKAAPDECYLVIAKTGNETSVSLEGQRDVLATSLYRLMKKYKNLAEVVLEAADAYDNDDL